GNYDFEVSVASNATNHALFEFDFAAAAALAGAIQISRSGPNFSNPGADTVTPATAGVQENLTYNIVNTGTGTLSNIVAAQFGAANNCAVNVGTPGSSSLAALGGNTTL